MAKAKKTIKKVKALKTKKIHVIQTKRIVMEYEIPEEIYLGYNFIATLKQYEEKTGTKIEPKIVDEKNLDAIVPIGEDALSHQTLKENFLILAEFQRIWNEYPRESFNSTMNELARTIHENCDTEDYAKFLPDDFNEKFLENIGTEENPDWVENEALSDERYDVEYSAIRKWISTMSNEELLTWLERLVEFLGY
jgi:hypothetical protein